MAIKNVIKRIIKNILIGISKVSIGKYIYRQIIDISLERSQVVEYQSHKLLFSVPNLLCKYRIDTFSTKEPDTLEWIDTIPDEKVLWDVGANIGLYSIYAAKARSCNVYAFEPSVFNLEFLARNIFQNNIQELITIIPVALSEKICFSHFKLTTTTWGGALSVFGQSYGQNGETIKDVFEYRLPGLAMDDAVNLMKVPMPNYIKIDVDGIEHLILSGGEEVLNHVDSVLIEINDEFTEQSEKSVSYLKKAGLTLYRKCDLGIPNLFNQWWVREHGSTTK
jgi:FkbM family methyltransferase